MFNTYTGGPQGSAVSPTREQMARAISEIRDAMKYWGDGDQARIIRGVLDRNGV